MDRLEFKPTFELLTGYAPFPWQEALYAHFQGGCEKIPKSCILPTGLGKTSVIAIWLIAYANGAKVPRRLVYVVNRRTVVDQTTEEVESYKKKVVAGMPDFGLSTLRGQFADNREWCANPSRPAVICGTVDMIGSRLLFSGYGLGMKARPLHAGFLGQDVLLVHDEAHLEPAFQTLIMRIEEQQKRENAVDFGIPKFQVMELTATSRSEGEPFTLTDKDIENETVLKRINSPKKLFMEVLIDPKKLVDQASERALQFEDSGLAILVFVRTVEDVLKIREKLKKEQVEILTGTLRGKERDGLVEKPVFKRFLPKPPNDAAVGTVYLICTSAGEVGVNISADHLVCDLSTFDSMAQRFGRVNRFGARADTEIHVIYPQEYDADKEYEVRLQRTQALLEELDGNASPNALGKLDANQRLNAFAPLPTILPATEMLFDAWALTSIKGKLPGRPDVEPFLHGLPTDWQPPETHIAWREEVDEITDSMFYDYPPSDLLSDFPLKPHGNRSLMLLQVSVQVCLSGVR